MSSFEAQFSDFQQLHVSLQEGVATATVDNPPVNVISGRLFHELRRFADWAAGNDTVRVVILRSDSPEFFIAHFDVSLLRDADVSDPPQRRHELNGFHQLCESFRTMPKATIAEIAGRVGGGGNELAMSCDMRFGAIGQTIVNQMEVPLGILPGGTGTQRLPRLVGTGRALEIILGADDLDAETAQQWGLLNRALPPDELRPFVDRLAARIASFPPGAVQRAKASVRNAETMELIDGMREEAALFEETMRLPETKMLMDRFLTQGGQTSDSEGQMGRFVMKVGLPD